MIGTHYLTFTVPVTVTVNLDAGEVADVVVEDESISSDPDGPEQCCSAEVDHRAAVEVANNVDWPEWRVG